MPNWTSNNIVIVGKKEKVDVIKDQLEKYYEYGGEWSGFFDYFLPTPKEMMEHPSPIRDEELSVNFENKYGAPDWYGWRINNWGTKWDISDFSDMQYQSEEIDLSMVSFNCETAWSPPEEGLRNLSKKFEDVYFYCQFEEPGMSFQGYCSFMNGEDIGSETVDMFPKFTDVIEDVEFFYSTAKMVVESE